MQAIVGDKSEDGWSVDARIKWIANNFYGFFKQVADEQIGLLSDSARQIIAKALHKLADRFWK